LGAGSDLVLWDADVMTLGLAKTRSLSIKNPNEHASLGRTVDGHDIYATTNYDPPSGYPDVDYDGILVTYDLNDSSPLILPKVIIGEKTGYGYPQDGHISAIAYKNPGWVTVSVIDAAAPPDGADLLDEELVVANADTGDVCRVTHHRSWGKASPQGYWAEPHGVPSPSGTRILFGSDWGGGATVDAYVVELPSYHGGLGDTVPPARPKGLRFN
jgi:hypothetical protein